METQHAEDWAPSTPEVGHVIFWRESRFRCGGFGWTKSERSWKTFFDWQFHNWRRTSSPWRTAAIFFLHVHASFMLFFELVICDEECKFSLPALECLRPMFTVEDWISRQPRRGPGAPFLAPTRDWLCPIAVSSLCILSSKSAQQVSLAREGLWFIVGVCHPSALGQIKSSQPGKEILSFLLFHGGSTWPEWIAEVQLTA